MNPRSAILLLPLVGLMRLPAQDAADEKPPEEMVQLRRQIEIGALTKTKLLADQFANALANIVREAGTEGDYEQALAAYRRREQLINLYTSSLDDAVLGNMIVLKPMDARTNGAVYYDRNLNALVGWKTAGSIASWDVSRLTPGSYEITLTYAVADIGRPGRPIYPPPDLTTGGEFEFYEDSSLTGANQNRRTGAVTSTGGWTNWTTLKLPPIQITRASARFALRITKAKADGGVMNLKSIRLAPPTAVTSTSGPQATPPNGAPAPVDEFTALQQAHVERLRQAITPVVNAFAENLNSLAEKLAATDADAASDYTAEARRAAQLLEEPQNIVSGPAKGPRQGPNADGFRELRDATYVQSERNTGDCFKVRRGEEEFFVRLLWVRCPSPDTADGKELKELTEYFGIGPEDARELGQQAQQFTAGFLSGKTLTLMTRGTKDDADNLLVGVRPAGMGEFAGVLVDHGLAMIKVPVAGKKLPTRLHEESVLRSLQERENAAKARAAPVGAWARKAVE